MWEQSKEEIDTNYSQFNLQQCIKLCLKTITQIKAQTMDDESFQMLFHCYYKLSSAYSSLGEYKKAVHYAKLAKGCADDDYNQLVVDFTISFYYYTYNDELSLYYINKLIKECQEKKYFELMYEGNVHKALLTNDEDLMIESIEFLKKAGMEEERIDEYYIDMVQMYINMNNLIKAQHTICKIKNIKLRSSMHQRVYDVAAL